MYLLSVNAGEILADAGLTTLTGMVVVFGVLLLLTGVFKLFGVVMSNVEKKGDVIPAAPVSAPASAPVAAPIVGNTAEVSSVPEVQNGIEPETVAVISAAVAAVAPAGTQYAVAGIRKM